MAIYIDPLRRYDTGLWCHMATDGNLDELHVFAAKIGLKRAWFQDHARVPHYDLRPGKRLLAVKAGAIQVSSVELVQKCRKV
jgi:hypothetical protein